jgi:rhamnopyranosyl-N-acetylglucosaminyl-diphospho-decaprenol beta-1,3/1,4-galactofuranosyltransferase
VRNMKYSDKNIAAVVVTYNRCQLLLECINALVSQTLKLDKIYIIDNCSTDDTEATIAGLGDCDNQLEYIRLQSNTGGSGGFHNGIAKAFNDGYEWIWLMDDDVEPMPHAIETLLKYKEISKCIHPGRVYSDGTKVEWTYIFDPIALLDVANPKASEFFGELIFTNVGCFEGMLINKAIVEKIGLPDTNFFLTKDDLLYGFEASAYTNVCVTRECLLRKKIRPQLPAKLNSLMHAVKNTLLVSDRLDILRPCEKRKRAIYKYLSLTNYLYTLVKHYKLHGIASFFRAIKIYKSIKKQNYL